MTGLPWTIGCIVISVFLESILKDIKPTPVSFEFDEFVLHVLSGVQPEGWAKPTDKF